MPLNLFKIFTSHIRTNPDLLLHSVELWNDKEIKLFYLQLIKDSTGESPPHHPPPLRCSWNSLLPPDMAQKTLPYPLHCPQYSPPDSTLAP